VTFSWRELSLLALGGVLGTFARAGLSAVVTRALPRETTFPWGTSAVNLLGCVAFGVCWVLIEARLGGSVLAKLCVLTGFMGAFTTFSTFAFETATLLQRSQVGLAVANLLLQNIVGVLLMVLGMSIGRALF
jgi:CrcB protein